MKTDLVFVDFENVQPKDIVSLDGGQYQIKVFLGAHQAKIPLAMARALQALGTQAEYIQINGSGNNAVDFHIAYYIGRLAATMPGARFHIISRDTGFDPLLKHLVEQGVSCQRVTSLAAVVSVKRDRATNADRLSAVTANLAKRKSGRPGTEKALRTTIQALFGKKLTELEVDELVKQLIGHGTVKISNGKVSY